MPRKKFISKREDKADARYGDILLQKFINKIMMDGKKNLAEKIVYSALEKVAKGKEDGVVDVFKKSIDNVRPLVMVKSTRIGGATYQVPTEITLDKSLMISMRWLIGYARKRSEKGIIDRLSAEFEDAYKKSGNAYKKREDTHKMAEANKAFAHFKY